MTKQQAEEERILQKANKDAILLSELSGCTFYPNNDGDVILRDRDKLVALLKRIRRNDRLCRWVLNGNLREE